MKIDLLQASIIRSYSMQSQVTKKSRNLETFSNRQYW